MSTQVENITEQLADDPRLRVLDVNTPWFWLTVFHRRAYGRPRLEISVWSPNRWRKWWFNFWQREP